MSAEAERQERLLQDWAVRAAKTGSPVTGRFIPEADMGQAVHAARQAGVEAAFNGGRPEAERVQEVVLCDGLKLCHRFLHSLIGSVILRAGALTAA